MACMTCMEHRRPVPLGFAAGLLVVMLTVTACGGSDKPAVCSDVDALQSSISSLTDVKLEQGALTDLTTKLSQVQADATKVKSEAETQFSTEIDAVSSAAASVKSSVDAASANASAQTLAAVATSLSRLTTALTALQTAVQDTC